MKRKILAVGLLALSCLSVLTADVDAFHLWHRNNRCVTHITCRPYNAFTPICWGNLVCDGCCPNPCAVAGGCMPMNCGMPPFAMAGSYMPYGCGGDSGYATDMVAPKQTNPPPTFNPPNPMPVGPGTTMMYPPMPYGVAQANYNPMYVPQYYYPNYYMPTYYNPYQPMPNYWYGYGR